MSGMLLNVLESFEKYQGKNSNLGVEIFADYSESGYKKLLHKSDVLSGKTCIIQIKNNDDLCLIRAGTVGQTIP